MKIIFNQNSRLIYILLFCIPSEDSQTFLPKNWYIDWSIHLIGVITLNAKPELNPWNTFEKSPLQTDNSFNADINSQEAACNSWIW